MSDHTQLKETETGVTQWKKQQNF